MTFLLTWRVHGGKTLVNQKPKNQEPIEGDPERGDAILRRMLKSKPKPHKEAVEERKARRKRREKDDAKVERINIIHARIRRAAGFA